MAKIFKLSSSPHVRDKTSVSEVMYSVIGAMVPALIGAVYFFGLNAVILIALCVVACVATEGVIQRFSGRPLTIRDGSAIVTGILLAFNLPAGASWWIPVIGSIFAIAVGKMTFGGLGYNPLNPALVGRVFLQISWPVQMNATWRAPHSVDAVTVATPLAILKENMKVLVAREGQSIDAVNAAMAKMSDLTDSYMDLFIGNVSGCIGETSVLLLLLGAGYLMYKRYVGWRIPFAYVGTVALLTWIFGGYEGLFSGPWLFHVLSGGLIIGAFFMATDMVTSPITFRGRLIFGIGCGVLTSVIRLWGGYPEGVSFSILLMNLTVPLIDRYTRPKVFGKAAK